MSSYVLTFDPARFAGQQKILDAMMKNHRLLDGWSSPFPGCYLLRSDSTAVDLRDTFDDLFSSRGFLISVVTRGSTTIDGRVPLEIWNWINQSGEADEVK